MKYLFRLNLLSFFIIVIPFMIFSNEWKQTNGPTGGHINAIVSCNDNFFVASNSSVHRLNHIDSSWKQTNYNLPDRHIDDLVIIDSIIFAGVFGKRIHVSRDMGETWNSIDEDINEFFTASTFASNDSVLFAAGSYGVYKSVDKGISWTFSSETIDIRTKIWNMMIFKSNIFMCTDSGVYRSSIDTVKWKKISITENDYITNVITCSDTFLFAGTDEGVFRSCDNGETWEEKNPGSTNTKITSLLYHDSVLYAGSKNSSVFRSETDGNTWILNMIGWSSGLHSSSSITAMIANDSVIMVGTEYLGIFISTNKGKDWQPTNKGLVINNIFALQANQNHLFAGNNTGYIFHTSDEGNNWNEISNEMLQIRDYLYDFEYVDSILFSVSDGGINRSLDNGATWRNVKYGMGCYDLIHVNKKLYVSTRNEGILVSNDFGDTWNTESHGLKTESRHHFITAHNENLYTASIDGTLYRKKFNDTSWVIINESNETFGLPLSGMISHKSLLFMKSNHSQKSLYKSINDGMTWELSTVGMENKMVLSMVSDGNILFAGTLSNGVFISKDHGISWQQLGTNLNEDDIWALAIQNNTLFASVIGKGVWKFPLNNIVSISHYNNTHSNRKSSILDLKFQSNTLYLEFANRQDKHVTVDLYTLRGQHIEKVIDNTFVSGKHSIKKSINGIRNGFYLFRIKADDYTLSKKVMLYK